MTRGVARVDRAGDTADSIQDAARVDRAGIGSHREAQVEAVFSIMHIASDPGVMGRVI